MMLRAVRPQAMQQLIHPAHPQQPIVVAAHRGMALQLLTLVPLGVEALPLAAHREAAPLLEQRITMVVSNSSRNRNFPIWRGMR